MSRSITPDLTLSPLPDLIPASPLNLTTRSSASLSVSPLDLISQGSSIISRVSSMLDVPVSMSSGPMPACSFLSVHLSEAGNAYPSATVVSPPFPASFASTLRYLESQCLFSSETSRSGNLPISATSKELNIPSACTVVPSATYTPTPIPLLASTLLSSSRGHSFSGSVTS